ncbi:coiled-coil domain-containing protein 84-like [Anneissia japonica]|uniref:coiled-coil domain-containing protein 84-like n=1 Tax=Anneissia japonica TaxID=1529436 RepID=UPI0014256BC3|nr:coiled-coil domain-containing protein 84-like [Anneissia japonica]
MMSEVYTYCDVCRINHTSANKHSFSSKHKARLKTILLKFGSKVADAKKKLLNPVITKASSETSEVKVWCYMCSLEVRRHEADDHAIIMDAGLLEHLATSEHSKKVHQFFWDNRLSKDQKQKYLVSDEELDSFKEALKDALSCYEDKEEMQLKKEAAKIQQVESSQAALLNQTLSSSSEQQSGSSQSEQQSRSRERQPGGSVGLSANFKVQTEGVIASDGLTFIGPSKCLSDGNIHTGAVPPWLRADDNNDSEQKPIGPTEKDFQEHLKKERKRKLNPGRVGANFDRASSSNADWLPSFGRVWNSGRRLQSRQQYQRETGNWKRRKADNSSVP